MCYRRNRTLSWCTLTASGKNRQLYKIRPQTGPKRLVHARSEGGTMCPVLTPTSQGSSTKRKMNRPNHERQQNPALKEDGEEPSGDIGRSLAASSAKFEVRHNSSSKVGNVNLTTLRPPYPRSWARLILASVFAGLIHVGITIPTSKSARVQDIALLLLEQANKSIFSFEIFDSPCYSYAVLRPC